MLSSAQLNMKIGVPKEIKTNENRIALVPAGAEALVQAAANAGDAFLDISVPRLGADFHAVYTAEQAGAYKPRYQAFEYMLDTLNAQPQDFLHVSSHTRYDLMPMHDMGFRNLVLLDRGYDPVPPGYDLTVVKSLDELNKHLGL